MIKVCDAIMGNGKSQSAITYLNEHPDGHYIYITPYLDEASRIANACPDLDFVEPMRDGKYGWSKLKHTHALIEQGRNIATTHQAFKNYPEEVLNAIKEFEYTLIIDENVDVLEKCDICEDDIQLALDAGYIEYVDGEYKLLKEDYRGEALKEMFWFLKSRQIIRIDYDECKHDLFYWVFPPELITSFKDVFILTYLFEGQSLHSFLKIYNLEYTNIGIEKIDGGTGFRFCDHQGYIPEYTSHISDMIEIVDSERFNEIGEAPTALSKSWFDRNKQAGINELKNNIYNIFRNVWKDSDAEQRMWATYKTYKEALKGKGYTNGYTVLNMRASNNYRDRLYLVYACNIFMNVDEQIFYKSKGIEVDNDRYALSIMLQWIWRSAIRDGQKIHIYLPSKRMRTILKDWMDSLGKEVCAYEQVEMSEMPVLRQV